MTHFLRRQRRPDAALGSRPRCWAANIKGLKLLAHASLPPQGTRPAFPATEPAYKPLVPCYTQALPDFNGPLSQGPADGTG